MAENSAIEWTHHTFNPWLGCTKISPGCDHCYAEGWAKRSGTVQWGTDRRRTTPQNWRQPMKWNQRAEAAGRRERVFCASLADVFDNQVPDAWRADLFWLIHNTPSLDWLLLTKRIGNAADMMRDGLLAIDPTGEWPAPWPNVWVGATVVDQAEADRDIQKLLAVPARVRFLSIEPLIGPVSIQAAINRMPWRIGGGDAELHWVIVGGESGPGARPMHPDWARNLRDECAAADVPYLFKQWGEWHPACGDTSQVRLAVPKHGGVAFQIEAGEHARMFDLLDRCQMHRIGKKAAGRLLDNREHNDFPTP